MNRSRMLQNLLSANSELLPSLDLQSTQNLESYALVNFARSSPKWIFNESGLLQEATDNTLPASYDPISGERKGWLIEESRTRLNAIAEAPTADEDISVSATSYTISFFGTGTVTLSGSHSATINGTGAFPVRTTLTFTPTAGTLTISYSGTCEHVQLEQGKFASSVIKGEGSQVTRSADVANVTDLSWYNQNNGSFIIEYFLIKNLNKTGGGAQTAMSVNDGGGSNSFRWYFNAGGTYKLELIYQSSYVADITQFSVPSVSSLNKGAYSYEENDINFLLNGSVIGTDTSNTIPTNLTRLQLGEVDFGGKLNGYIKRLQYYPNNLPNAELQTLTS